MFNSKLNWLWRQEIRRLPKLLVTHDDLCPADLLFLVKLSCNNASERKKKVFRRRGCAANSFISINSLHNSFPSVVLWMPVLPAPDSLSTMTDIWPTMARFSALSPDSDHPFSSSPSFPNGNMTTVRTISDQTVMDSFKDRHNRLMNTENEKNKLIEVWDCATGFSPPLTDLGPHLPPRTYWNSISKISSWSR